MTNGWPLQLLSWWRRSKQLKSKVIEWRATETRLVGPIVATAMSFFQQLPLTTVAVVTAVVAAVAAVAVAAIQQ